ncbi:proteasome activator complex subunit 4 [Frankliniella occidentalis]|uniref:Proteasome activator complex subunit 4 n=1 Tax=Frankliniella occidentalis TaxID=133901 RepID=A0A6J1RXT5_FRAOC|nr:proteasome activator complex subunit 4 [Frankliniella occidentalis]
MADCPPADEMDSFWYQKEKKLDRLLPYFDSDKFNDESQAIFDQIKVNLGKAIVYGGAATSYWAGRLNKFTSVYGLRISKKDHAALVKLLFDTIVMPGTEEALASELIMTLLTLIKHEELLSPQDVQLPWQPLYEFYRRIVKQPVRFFPREFLEVLHTFIKSVNKFFPVESTAQILDTIMPLISPLDKKSLSTHLNELCLFLPTMPHHAEKGQGYLLWMNDLLSMWDSCNNSATVNHNLMALMARLAKRNVGRVDWEPHVAVMFTRIMRSLKLPVLYKSAVVPRSPYSESLDIQHSSLWIIACLGGGSSAQKHLTDMLRAVESYFNPANTGSWVAANKLRNVVFSLPDAFVKRLFYERKKELKWLTPIPKEKCLTEDDITAFVESMCPIVNQVLIGHIASLTSAFQRVLFCLAWLRPAIIIPPIIERLMTAITSETEPLRVSAALASLSAVMRPMIEGARLGYPEGPLQVTNLLTTIIPMVDFNDPMKARCTILILERLLKFVPLIDSSKEIGLHPNMTQEEEELCRSTAEFKDCLMLMVDRVLSLVHFSSSSTLVSFDIRVQTMTVSVFRLTLVQTPPEFFKAALNKLHHFVTDNISPGPMLSPIVEAFVHVNAEETWKILLPSVTEAILNITETENIKSEQTLSSELMHHLGLLKDLLAMGPLNKLIPYMPVLNKVLEATLHLENLEGHTLAVQIWERIITLANKMVISNFRSSEAPYDSPPGAHLHIREWGKSVPVKMIKAEWIIPDEEAISCIQKLINKFLPAEIQTINNFIMDSDKVTKENLQQALRITKSVLECQLLLPFWNESPLQFDESFVADLKGFRVETGLKGEITMIDGSNMRHSLIALMERLQEKLLINSEDDTTSCCVLIEIWRKLLFLSVKQERTYRSMAHWERDPMSLPNLPRLTLLYGANEHAIKRCAFFATPLTSTHTRGLLCILKLATSHYSKVRVWAQHLLDEFEDHYNGALVQNLLQPYLLSNLKVDSVEQHELFKGTLYVMTGLSCLYNWKMSSELWVALVNSKPTEKLSVIRKIGDITKAMLSGQTENVQREVSDQVQESILMLCCVGYKTKQPLIDRSYLVSIIQEQTKSNVKRLQKWHDLQMQLVSATESGTLHWRHSYLAIGCLRRLIYTLKERASATAVKCLLQCLVSDNIHIRKAAPLGLAMILQQQKQETKFVTLKCSSVFPPDGPKGTGDNRKNGSWLQYDVSVCPSSNKDWDGLNFIHKEHLGYIKWPEEIKVPSPNTKQPPFDDPERILPDDEKEVDAFFQNEKNVASLVSYMALEKSTFDDCYVLFSKLFRNTGDKYLPLFQPHIESLLDQKLETQQMFLFALLAGIIHGTKRWSYDKLVALWDWLAPVIVAAHENLCVVDDRTLSLIPSMRKRDPFTQYWLIEILMDDPLREDASVLGCRRLDLISSILLMKNWRVISLAHRALDYVKPYLSHHLKNVRNSVGRLLGKVFHTDFQLPGANQTLGPHIDDFIASVVPQLEVLKSLNITVNSSNAGKNNSVGIDDVTEQLGRVEVSSSEHDNALRLFETVSVCMQQMLRDSPAAMYPCFYQLLEPSILLENVAKDKDLRQICEKNIALLASAFTKPSCIPVVLEAIYKVDNHPSWAMRVSCLGFLQVLVFQNMPIFASQSDWTEKVIDLVVLRLDDSWLEVQHKAGEVLSGMLHCHFIPHPLKLMERFKEKANIRLSRKAPDPSKLRTRHAGIIGLCAYVRAFPYDVPDFVPDVIGILGDHLNDPHPISKTIRDTLSSFQRTHIGQWHLHRRCFTEDQLNALSNMVLPPSHYV